VPRALSTRKSPSFSVSLTPPRALSGLFCRIYLLLFLATFVALEARRCDRPLLPTFSLSGRFSDESIEPRGRHAMYFPSPLPTTRLSVSTSAVPVGPSPTLKTTVYKTPGRPAKGKFKDSLGGVLEEEGEEILSIARGPDASTDSTGQAPRQTLWAALGREELSVWSIRVSRFPNEEESSVPN
jgi:hypothetical protein